MVIDWLENVQVKMTFRACLLLSLAFCPASPMPSPNMTFINKEWKDIPDINKGLHLKEGDIMVPRERSSILGDQYRWEIPVPYVLSANLSVDTKGVILRAFEQFRLKSCIDFKPRTTEEFYISVEKNRGCWSYVGRQYPQGQTLSIGEGCEYIAIVEHEFLHALGFYHEQSRYDRDDYVTINYTNIIADYQSNFNKHSENVTSTQGTPYDYMSVMHYDKNAFSNGNGPTIITKLPEFQDVIGQRIDMSEYDAIELNGLYKCNSSISFLDHCSFDDESLCRMSVCSTSGHGWQRVSSVGGVNVTDHTYLGKEPNGTSFFMHFSARGRNEGDSARLESREMTPTRDCKIQCLQFYYYHSGNENDQLNIWIREYQNAADSRGTLRLMDQITGHADNYWRLHHVQLNTNKTFQVVFEARKGAGNSSGGFSLDDINISQTECPNIWQIRNFETLMNNTPKFTSIESPLYYSSEGYRYQLFIQKFNEVVLGMFIHLVSGVFDDQLQWPCPWRQVTFQVLDQNPHMQKRMSNEYSFTTDPDYINVWGNPRNGTQTIIGNETVYVRNAHVGFFYYFSDLKRRDFIKAGDIIVLHSMQDISGLFQMNSLPCPKVKVRQFNKAVNESANQGPCVTRAVTTPQPTLTTVQRPTHSECLHTYCSSAARTLPCALIFLVGFSLSLLN